MSTREPAVPPASTPRGTWQAVVAVWVVAALIGVAVAVFAPTGSKALWLGIGLAGCLVVSFAVHLALGTPHRFIARVGVSMLGSLVVLALVGVGIALASLATA